MGVASSTAMPIIKQLRMHTAIRLVKRLVRPVLRKAAGAARYVLWRLLEGHIDTVRDQIGDAETAIRAVQFDLRAMQRHLALLEDKLNGGERSEGRNALS